MKKLLQLLTIAALACGVRYPALAQTLDPGFAPSAMYETGMVYGAVEQPDGERLIAGTFKRINGTAASGLARLNPDGTLDAAFQQNVGLAAECQRVKLLRNGQILAIDTRSTSTAFPLTIGGITRTGLLKLNSDGTGDASFNAGSGPGQVNVITINNIKDAVQLANGKFIVVGRFDTFNGHPASRIVRLLPSGAVDTTFRADGGVPSGQYISRIVELPNGQLLAGGYFQDFNGHPANSLVRLNSDGSWDSSFSPGPGGTYSDIVVQPDGKILVGGSLRVVTTNSLPNHNIARLLPNGAEDSTFTPPLSTLTFYPNDNGDAILLLPNGKIIVNGAIRFSASTTSGIGPLRLYSDGTLDPLYIFPPRINGYIQSLTYLATGQILLSGKFSNYSSSLDRSLILLNRSGSLNSSFQPLIELNARVTAVARQSDGRLVVGGSFTSVNGVTARRLARFNPDGTLDASFSATVGLDVEVLDLAIQPDGRILVVTLWELKRFLPNGTPDNSFTSAAIGFLTRMLLLANGQVMLGGRFLNVNGQLVNAGLVRLQPDGSLDSSFSAPYSLEWVQAMAQQPDGNLVLAGRIGPFDRSILRLTTTGAIDPKFGGSFFNSSNDYAALSSLVVLADGKIIVGGQFQIYGTTLLRPNLIRLNSDGTADNSYIPPALNDNVTHLLLQPNGRLLLSGLFTNPNLPARLARLLPSGLPDPSFGTSAQPNGAVNNFLIQPDGAIVLVGSFTAVGGQPYMGVARLRAPNVLAVPAPAAPAAHLDAWPVPAHEQLTVQTEATAHALALDLLDMLGRPVRHLPLLPGASRAALPCLGLPPGPYLLRVTYAEGVVARRVQLQ